ncbi:unnamed protein product [Lasius platythorax]|uniref:Uncharacterized protein n=1 Tax=Lasius platythorax TaxID=488582 RepID=A0AAV2NWN1_9HYME
MENVNEVYYWDRGIADFHSTDLSTLGIINIVNNLDGLRASVPNIPAAVLESPSHDTLVFCLLRTTTTQLNTERTDDKPCHLNKGPHAANAHQTRNFRATCKLHEMNFCQSRTCASRARSGKVVWSRAV